MTNGLTAYHTSSQATCEICGCTINHPDTLLIADPEFPVCRSFDCRKTLSQKSTMTPALFSAHVAFQKKLQTERLAKEARQKKRIADVTANECREHKQILHTVLDHHPKLRNINLHLLVIPSGLSQVTPVPAERITDYTQHLHNIINQAAEHKDATEVVQDQHFVAHEKLARLEQQFAKQPALQSISDRICGMCRGGCCESGKDHAYLSVITIRRYMDQHPNQSPQAIQAMYLSHVQSQTIANACINQTPKGCGLPRELRSDICNEYYCDALKQYQKKQTGKAEMTTVLAIQRSGNHWNRYDPAIHNDVSQVAVIDENKLQRMAITLKEPGKSD